MTFLIIQGHAKTNKMIVPSFVKAGQDPEQDAKIRDSEHTLHILHSSWQEVI